jgi:GT2 family glycosyltransferase
MLSGRALDELEPAADALDAAAWSEEAARLRTELAAREAELAETRQQQLILRSFVTGLTTSRAWKLLRPIQALKNLVWPACFGLGDLYPNEQLLPAPCRNGGWIAAGPDAAFIIPRWLPAGWLRLQIDLWSKGGGCLVLEAQHGMDRADVVSLGQIQLEPGRVKRELLVPLRCPAIAARLRPILKGQFRVAALRLQVERGPRVWLRQLSRALRRSVLREDELLIRPFLHGRIGNSSSGNAVELPASVRPEEYPSLSFPGPPSLDWSIIIPTVNEVDRVVQCIQSCRQWLPREASVEFLVVDDGTRDPALRQALAQAAEDFEFTVHFAHQNLGFSAAVNLGMRHSKGRNVVLCNNDIVFFQPWLEQLAEAFAGDPAVGIIGARLLYPDGRIQHAGIDKAPNTMQWVHAHGNRPGTYPAANRARPVWAVTGALFALRRTVLERLGGFSTAYALGHEDLDYCLHAWAQGVHVRYRPDVVAYHLEGGTRGGSAVERAGKPLLWSERERAGRVYFEKKWTAVLSGRLLEDFLV